MAVIDLENIQKSLNYLADKQEGRNALVKFRVAMEELRGSVPTNPSDAEYLYMLQRLVGQLQPHDLAGPAKGELNEKQLDAVVGGATSTYFTATSVKTIGDFRQIGNLGFRIRAAAQ